MKNKTTTTAPNLGDLQKKIDDFYFWSKPKHVRSALFDLLTYAMQSKEVKELHGKDRAELVTTVKMLGEFVTDLEPYSSSIEI